MGESIDGVLRHCNRCCNPSVDFPVDMEQGNASDNAGHIQGNKSDDFRIKGCKGVNR